MELNTSSVVVALVVVLAAPLLYNLWLTYVSTPLRMKRAFQAQGITTLPFHFISGNFSEIAAMRDEARRHPMPQLSHDIVPRILTHLFQWPQKYGAPYVYWLGPQAHYDLLDAEDAKDILSTKSGHYSKPDMRPDASFMFGNGILSLEGEKWAQHRRVMNPAFFIDKLKAMIPTMAACTTAMMENWATLIEAGLTIDVEKCLGNLTADIIAHTAFGSSFEEGKQMFELQHEQQVLMEKVFNSMYIPGARFLPTAFNRHCWKIDRDLKRVLHQVINMHKESIRGVSNDNDLLGLMMAANKHEHLIMTTDDILDDCKTFFFAGHESTSKLLTWTFLLLATNPEWQMRTRAEVLAVCDTTDVPTVDTVNNLKIMSMVLNEALRLYPPAILMYRKACTDMQVGKVVVPKGTVITLPILAWYHDERCWGADANEFRPERFSEGVAKASRSVAAAYMPFSMGPRICIGQNFALLAAKVVMCMILRRYRFHLSPTYQHAPSTSVTLRPEFGMPILFENL